MGRIIAGLFLAALLAAPAWSADESIVGLWESSENGKTVVIEFKADGTGALKENEHSIPITYKIDTTKTPHHLDISFTEADGDKVSMPWIAAFEGKDKLKMANNRTGGKGQVRMTEFTKEDTTVFTRKQ